MPSLGWNFTPSRPDLLEVDSVAYWAEYAVQLAAAKAVRAGEPVEGEEEEEEIAAFTVTEAARDVAVSDLGSSVKAVVLAARALGWETTVRRSRTHHEPVTYKSSTEVHNAGDVRYAANDRRNYLVEAKAPTAALGFSATWMGRDDPKVQQAWDDRPFMSKRWIAKEPKDPACQTAAGFVDVTVRDPIGLPIENYFDYRAKKTAIDTFGKKRATEYAALQNQDYNDGTGRMEAVALYRSSTPFLAWLDEWLELLAPDHKKLSKATKPAPEPETVEFRFPSVLDQTEWSHA